MLDVLCVKHVLLAHYLFSLRRGTQFCFGWQFCSWKWQRKYSPHCERYR